MRRFVMIAAISAVLASPAQAAVLTWTATLSGSQEIPPAETLGTGFGTVEYNDVTNVLSLYLEWESLTGPGVQAHIHCCVLSPPGNVGIAIDLWLPSDPPQPATGSFAASYDLDLVNPFRASFVSDNGGTTASALAALIEFMNTGEGRAYFNIHTAQFPGGEIRGNLAPVPEPATFALMLGGIAGVLLRRRLVRP